MTQSFFSYCLRLSYEQQHCLKSVQVRTKKNLLIWKLFTQTHVTIHYCVFLKTSQVFVFLRELLIMYSSSIICCFLSSLKDTQHTGVSFPKMIFFYLLCVSMIDFSSSCFFYTVLTGYIQVFCFLWQFWKSLSALSFFFLPYTRIQKISLSSFSGIFLVCSSYLLTSLQFPCWTQSQYQALRKKCPYSELFCSAFFPHFPRIFPNRDTF